MFTRILAAAALCALAAHGQTSRGTVTGTILDVSGSVVPNARITLTSTDTGARFSNSSNDAGVYRFDAVDLGTYELSIAQPGFRTWRASGVRVEANRVTTVDPHLEIGTAEITVQVSGESAEILTKDSPLRGGNFQPREVRDLPLVSLNPLSLARTLPGVTDASGSKVWTGTGNAGGGFSVNGQRPRGNNYMIDGTENNDVWLTGAEQAFSIADAIEEVSVQTGNFSVEFGRAGGGVFNVVTKSGTNNVHGTLSWRYRSQRFDSVSNLDRLNRIPKSVFSNNVAGFTAGGPVRKNKTFFFAGFQENDRHSTQNTTLQLPTADAVTRLRALFPNNPRLDLYLGALGEVRGTAVPFSVALGADPATGVDRGSVLFAAGAYVLPAVNDGPQWLARVDHYQSERHRLSLRYTYDSHSVRPSAGATVSFPGFVQQDVSSHHNVLFTDSYTFGPSYTNEFRFSYGRPDTRAAVIWPGSVAAAFTVPAITIANVSAPGVNSNNTQFHYGNNFLFQETQTKLSGRHAFRYGAEILRQLNTQARAINSLGTINFRDATALGYSAFANFLDDFSGPGANANRVFGAPVLHANQLHQSYFFQDNWKVQPSLTLTLGLRYDNFGQPANSLAYPAFAGFDPSQFLVRQEVTGDNNNFGPAIGVAWSPRNGNTVLRGGYQISYDALFTQLIFLGPASTTPNAISRNAGPAPNAGRGTANWMEQLPTSASAPSLADNQIVLDKDLRNPYTERWSFGVQRQLRPNLLLDVAYIGSGSHKLTTKAEFNPLLPSGQRLYPGFGGREARTSEGNSTYHALQTRFERRFARGFEVQTSYTWSKYLDSTSEGAGNLGVQQPDPQNRTSVPAMFGGLKLDHGSSDFDRPHRLTIAYLWTIPGPRHSWLNYALGGWSVAGITTFQSGTPFSLGNGFDRNGDGIGAADRPDIGNRNAPLNTRAIVFPQCATGYQNPDTLACVTRSEVHWVEGRGFPNAATVGRNTLRTGGTNNFDLSLSKRVRLGETRSLELRGEALNAFNHPQYVNVPLTKVNGTPAGRFLNRDFTDSGIRSMWVQVKVVF